MTVLKGLENGSVLYTEKIQNIGLISLDGFYLPDRTTAQLLFRVLTPSFYSVDSDLASRFPQIFYPSGIRGTYDKRENFLRRISQLKNILGYKPVIFLGTVKKENHYVSQAYILDKDIQNIMMNTKTYNVFFSRLVSRRARTNGEYCPRVWLKDLYQDLNIRINPRGRGRGNYNTVVGVTEGFYYNGQTIDFHAFFRSIYPEAADTNYTQILDKDILVQNFIKSLNQHNLIMYKAYELYKTNVPEILIDRYLQNNFKMNVFRNEKIVNKYMPDMLSGWRMRDFMRDKNNDVETEWLSGKEIMYTGNQIVSEEKPILQVV